MWCPAKYEEKLYMKIQNMSQNRDFNPPQIKKLVNEAKSLLKPTYFETNEFTYPFQEIINTYGVPNYKEVNPTVFTIITFPMQFGMMFGDVFHGTILTIISLLICFSERKPGTVFGDLGGYRYLLLLMGIFATFCGFIYNDMTSIPLYLFGESCYEVPHGNGKAELKPDCTYPVGIDPTWYLATNELTFINSLKMKLAVIVGVWQMGIGVIFKGFNNVHYSKPIDFLFEFLP